MTVQKNSNLGREALAGWLPRLCDHPNQLVSSRSWNVESACDLFGARLCHRNVDGGSILAVDISSRSKNEKGTLQHSCTISRAFRHRENVSSRSRRDPGYKVGCIFSISKMLVVYQQIDSKFNQNPAVDMAICVRIKLTLCQQSLLT